MALVFRDGDYKYLVRWLRSKNNSETCFSFAVIGCKRHAEILRKCLSLQSNNISVISAAMKLIPSVKASWKFDFVDSCCCKARKKTVRRVHFIINCMLYFTRDDCKDACIQSTWLQLLKLAISLQHMYCTYWMTIVSKMRTCSTVKIFVFIC